MARRLIRPATTLIWLAEMCEADCSPITRTGLPNTPRHRRAARRFGFVGAEGWVSSKRVGF